MDPKEEAVSQVVSKFLVGVLVVAFAAVGVRTVGTFVQIASFGQENIAAVLLAQATTGVLPQPTMNTPQCNADGTSVLLTWSAVAGSEVYAVRVDDPTNNASSCIDGWYCGQPDYASELVGGPSIRFTTVPGRAYEWWVHAKKTASWDGASGYTKKTFTCRGPVNANVTLTSPSEGAVVTLGNAIPIAWNVKGALARMQVEYTITQMTSDGSGTIGGGKGMSGELPQGTSSGSAIWPTGTPGSLDRAGTYMVQLALVDCNAQGCTTAPSGRSYALSQVANITIKQAQQTCPAGTTGTYPNCVTKPTCMNQPAPTCAPGAVLVGSGNDVNGCPLPAHCEMPQTQTCPVQSTCVAGQTQTTTVDERGCTMIRCTSPQTSGTGHISIKRVGVGLTTWSAPANTKAVVDTMLSTQMNPGKFTFLQPGPHTVSFSDMPGYIETAGVCTYQKGSSECSVTSFNETISCNGTVCSMPVIVTTDQVVKVVAQYEKDSTVTCQGTKCTQPGGDVCPNLAGVQTTVPSGYTRDSTGICVTIGTQCPQVMPPYCPNGTLVSVGTSANGCSLGYRCEATQTQPCPPGTAGHYPLCEVLQASNMPSCTITTNKASYMLGETITASWTSQNATYATWISDGSGKDNFQVTVGALSPNGSKTFTADVLGNPYLVMLVNGQGGYGVCSKVIPVSSQ